MVVANTCEFFGFDSELTAACCRKLDCDVETLKNIASWFKKNASIVPDTFHDNQLKQLNKAQKAEQRAVDRRDKLAEGNRETRKALKEMEEKLKDLKKLQKDTRELQPANNLLKKIHDGINKNS